MVVAGELAVFVAFVTFFPRAFRKIGASLSSSVGGADESSELSESLMAVDYCGCGRVKWTWLTM